MKRKECKDNNFGITSSINAQKIFLTNQTKTAYIFTLCWLIYQLMYLLISLNLPWASQGNFFETAFTRFNGGVYVESAYLSSIIFLIAIILTIISIVNEKKGVLNKSKPIKTICSLPVIWLIWWLGWFILYIMMVFFTWGPIYSGMGAKFFSYFFYGGIGIVFPELNNLSLIYTLSMLILPVLISGFGLIRMDKKKESLVVKNETKRNESIKKYVQMIGWVCCVVITIGVFIYIMISLFLPWSIFDNFVIFLSQINVQNAGFFVSIVVGVFLLIFNLILILLPFFTIKPWSKLRNDENPPYKRLLKNLNLSNILYWWFLCWNFLWVVLSTSIAYYLTSELPYVGAGLMIYISTAHLTVMMSIIMGMGIVLYYIILYYFINWRSRV